MHLAESHWLLIVLCAVGAILVLVAPIAPILAARRLRKPLDELQHERVLLDLADLGYQGERISSHGPALAALLARVRVAQDSLRESGRELCLPEAAIAVRALAATARALTDLHN